MRLRLMPIDIEIPRRHRQPQLDAVQLFGQHNLTAEPRVLAQVRRHVEQIVLLLFGPGQPIDELVVHVHVTRGAGERRLAGALHVDAVPVGQVEGVIADFAAHRRPVAVLVDVGDVHAAIMGMFVKPFGIGLLVWLYEPYTSLSSFGSCHSNSP